MEIELYSWTLPLVYVGAAALVASVYLRAKANRIEVSQESERRFYEAAHALINDPEVDAKLKSMLVVIGRDMGRLKTPFLLVLIVLFGSRISETDRKAGKVFVRAIRRLSEDKRERLLEALACSFLAVAVRSVVAGWFLQGVVEIRKGFRTNNNEAPARLMLSAVALGDAVNP